MGEVWRVRGKGSFPSLKVALSDGSGEILWPLPAFFVQAYGQTQRQPLKVLDKSEGPIRQTYQEIVGSEAPPMLAAPQINSTWTFVHVLIKGENHFIEY